MVSQVGSISPCDRSISPVSTEAVVSNESIVSSVFEKFRRSPPSMRRQMQSDMEQARFAKLVEVLTLGLKQDTFGMQGQSQTLSGDNPFKKQVQKLRQEIERLSKCSHVKAGTVAAIREDLHKLFVSEGYKDAKMEHDPHVNFLQLLSLKLQTADGLKVLRDKVAFEVSDSEVCVDVLREDIAKRLEAPSTVSKTKSVFWFVKNPSCAMSSLLSKVRAHVYRPFKLNPSHLGPVFKGDGTRRMQSFYAPSPTGDAIWEDGVIPAMKKMGTYEVFFSFQDANLRDEKVRIEQAEAVAKRSLGTIKHVVFGFDAKVKLKTVQELLAKEGEDFLNGYVDFYKSNCRELDKAGMSIPKDLLSDEELGEVLSSAKTYFKPSLDRSSRSQKLAMIMGIDAIVANAILDKQMESLPDLSRLDPDFRAPFIRACCKQHVDRGTVMLNAIWLMREFRNQPGELTVKREDAQNIACTVLGRAHLVDNRMIIQKKADRLLSLMRLIAAHK